MTEKYFQFKVTDDGWAYVVQGRHGELRARYPSRTQADLDARRLNAAFDLGKEKAPRKTRRMFPTIGSRL